MKINTSRRPRKTAGQIADEKRIRAALPSAREVYAVRFRQTDTTTDKHGRDHATTRAVGWPAGFTVRDVLGRVLQVGLR